MAKTDDEITTSSGERVRFLLGETLLTQGALAILAPDEANFALSRHQRGDWGDIPKVDREENELSVREGFRILSVYRSCSGVRFWVITEADRSSTTILLPEEY